MSMRMVVVSIILLILLGILMYNLFRGQLFLGGKYNQFELQASLRSCKAQAVAAFDTAFFDNDYGKNQGDGFPDGCDLCKGGDDAKDQDVDGMPDACDNDPRNAPERGKRLGEICEEAKGGKGKWDQKRFQCTLPNYGKSRPKGT